MPEAEREAEFIDYASEHEGFALEDFAYFGGGNF
jgi:hypothetical protein